MAGATKHRIRVASSSRWNVVVPRDVIAARGDIIEFKSVGEKNVTIMFPNEALFGPSSRAIDLNGDRAWKMELTVPADAELGAYPFVVYCDENKDYAEGNPPPRMIIIDD